MSLHNVWDLQQRGGGDANLDLTQYCPLQDTRNTLHIAPVGEFLAAVMGELWAGSPAGAKFTVEAQV